MVNRQLKAGARKNPHLWHSQNSLSFQSERQSPPTKPKPEKPPSLPFHFQVKCVNIYKALK